MSGTRAAVAGCRTVPSGCTTNRHPMEDEMLARAAAPRKRRCVEFRRTRSPRDVLISLPFRQPSDRPDLGTAAEAPRRSRCSRAGRRRRKTSACTPFHQFESVGGGSNRSGTSSWRRSPTTAAPDRAPQGGTSAHVARRAQHQRDAGDHRVVRRASGCCASAGWPANPRASAGRPRSASRIACSG